MDKDLESIVIGCQQKDAKAQKYLYDMFAPSMLGVCMRYTRSRDEAQDILQDGFLSAFEKITQLKNPAVVKSWLHQIMVNLSINYVTRNCNLQYYENDDLERIANTTTEEELDEPLNTDIYNIHSVLDALQHLPEHYQLVYNLREIEEMEYSDIATQLGLTESTIRGYVSRARQQLRLTLEKKDTIL